MTRRADMVRCVMHQRLEPREGRVWGRDGHLGVTQARVLLWLVWTGKAVHPREAIECSAARPSLGWPALAQLVEAGCVRQWDEWGEPLVEATRIGRASARDADADPFPTRTAPGTRDMLWPSTLSGFRVGAGVIFRETRRGARHATHALD